MHNEEWVEEMFEKHEDEHCEFDRIENPEHPRRDLCAFLILDRLIPGKGEIISGASHDIIHLTTARELASSATEEDIIRLVRCGCHLEDGYYVAMFK